MTEVRRGRKGVCDTLNPTYRPMSRNFDYVIFGIFPLSKLPTNECGDAHSSQISASIP